MAEQREFELRWEGRRCQVGELGAKAARHVALRLVRTLGEALQEGGVGMSAEVLQVLGAILSRARPELLDWLTEQFLGVTYIEREAGTEDWVAASGVQELMFAGPEGLARWFRWLAFCVEVSCGDFFGALIAEGQARKAAGTAAMAGAASPSPSPTTSRMPGFSTASRRAGDTRTA